MSRPKKIIEDKPLQRVLINIAGDSVINISREYYDKPAVDYDNLLVTITSGLNILPAQTFFFYFSSKEKLDDFVSKYNTEDKIILAHSDLSNVARSIQIRQDDVRTFNLL